MDTACARLFPFILVNQVYRADKMLLFAAKTANKITQTIVEQNRKRLFWVAVVSDETLLHKLCLFFSRFVDKNNVH